MKLLERLRLWALILFLIIIVLQLLTYVASIERFKITQITFSGTEYLSEDILQRATEPLMHRSLILISHTQIASLLEPFKQIADFKIAKHYPHTLEIKIIERIPLAKITLYNKIIIFDKDGIVLNDGSISYVEFLSVPEIRGVTSLADLKETMTIVSGFLKKISHFTKTDNVILDIQNPMNYVLYLDHVTVKLGNEQFLMSKASALEALYPIIKSRKNAIVYVDVRSPQNAVIRYNR